MNMTNTLLSLSLPLLCCCLGFLPYSACFSGLNITLSYSGSFQINVGGKPWFLSASPFLVADGVRYGVNNSFYFPGQLPVMDGELQLTSRESKKGSDVLGTFQAMQYVYMAGETRMDLEIRSYESAVVFSQTFPDGLENPGIADNRPVLSGFPALQWDMALSSLTSSGYLTFTGDLTGEDSVTLAKWNPFEDPVPSGINASGPLCYFNTSSKDVVIVSPLTQAMHVSPWHRIWNLTYVIESQSYWGLDRTLPDLPPDFKAEVILYYSPSGLGKALEEWGALYHLYNRPPMEPSARLRSTALDDLGYWTGPGSCYGDLNTTSSHTTYEDILLAVAHNAKNNSVPLRFFELDQWWYESVKGASGSVVTWEANNQSLPSGITTLQRELGLPVAAVLGYWSSRTTYAEQNNGSYAFLLDGDYALPLQKEFWIDLFNNASQSNITHVIVDNIATQYFGVAALQTRAGLAGDWLRNLSTAAFQAGITLTLSNVLPRIAMEASQYPAVLQVRVSEPYMESDNSSQWKIGVTSALARALGLAAFKDTFWSHGHQPDNCYSLSEQEEREPTLQALVATLSTGSVVLGDSEKLIVSSMTHRCCRSDGVVLKPSKAASATDAQLTQTVLNETQSNVGQMWSTISTFDVITGENVTSSYTQGVMLAADMPSTAFKFTPFGAFPGVFKGYRQLRVWSWVDGKEVFWGKVADQQPLSFRPDQCNVTSSPAMACVFYVSPPLVLNHSETIEVYLGGEDKFVPLSPNRVRAINITSGATLTLQGQPGEAVAMFYYVDDERRQFNATISSEGVSVVELDVSAPPLPSTSTHSVTSTTPSKGSALEQTTELSALLVSAAASLVVSFLLI